MKIAVLGTGVVGQTLAEKLTELGHEVKIGTRNVEEAFERTGPGNFGRPGFAEWAGKHPQIKPGTFSDASAFGEIIINTTNGMGAISALNHTGKQNHAGKPLIDVSNPLDFSKGFPPTLSVCNDDSLGEQIQSAFPDVKVIKTLNTLTANLMVNPSLVPGDHNVFMNGNDAGAKETVKKILESFGWKSSNIFDMGGISTARGTEQLLPIWVRLMGLFQNNGMFNFHIVK